VPASCCTDDYDKVFDARTARRQLTDYHRRGASGTTARLIGEIKAAGVAGTSVMDIGGGVGVIGLELLAAGATSVTGVDASAPYVAVARQAFERAGWEERATVHHADFVEVAEQLDAADVVTLDRVVCCYGDWQALVDASAARARRLLGLVYPNSRWYVRAAVALGNLALRISGRTFRGYVHPEARIDARIRRAGFEPRSHHRGWAWQTIVYERVGTAADAA
jgi:SAM-dependent methyltransferase